MTPPGVGSGTDVVHYMNDLTNSLLTMKVSQAYTAEVARGVNDFSREVAVETHFGEYRMDDWAVDFV